MELSRRDAFRPCSRDSSGDKGRLRQKSRNGKGGQFQLRQLIIFVLANENKIDLCHLKSPLSKNETRRDGSIPFIVIKSLFSL